MFSILKPPSLHPSIFLPSTFPGSLHFWNIDTLIHASSLLPSTCLNRISTFLTPHIALKHFIANTYIAFKVHDAHCYDYTDLSLYMLFYASGSLKPWKPWLTSAYMVPTAFTCFSRYTKHSTSSMFSPIILTLKPSIIFTFVLNILLSQSSLLCQQLLEV